MRLGPNLSQRYSHYVYTQSCYKDVHEGSPLLGLDCEMCVTEAGKMELTSVCLVDTDSKVMIVSLVNCTSESTNFMFAGFVPESGEATCKDQELPD